MPEWDREKGRDVTCDGKGTGRPDGVGCWNRSAGGFWRRLEHRGAELWLRLFGWRLAGKNTLKQGGGWLWVLDGDNGKGRDGKCEGEGTGRLNGVRFWNRSAGGFWRRLEHRGAELWLLQWWWRLLLNCSAGCIRSLDRDRDRRE